MSRTEIAQSCQTRHAVILAAGESKRTRPLTAQRPKPLIPLLGQPLLAHILDELYGIVDLVTLVVGYRAGEIISTFGLSYRGIALRYVFQEQVNGTAGALLAVGQIDQPFFLLYGDNLISQVDLLGVAAERYSLAGLQVEDARSFGVLQVADGAVRGILEKPSDPPPGALANPGIYHFDSAVFPLLAQIKPSPRGEYELTDLITMLAEANHVGFHICKGHWVPVGTPWEALSAAQFSLARRSNLQPSCDPAADIAADVQIEGYVQIGKARIGAGTRIVGPAVIGDGCVIGPNCLVEQSVLEAGAKLDRGVVVRNSVCGADTRIWASSLVESSWLDTGASIGAESRLSSHHYAELRPVADTAGLLSRAMLCTRGAIISQGTRISPHSNISPGSVL